MQSIFATAIFRTSDQQFLYKKTFNSYSDSKFQQDLDLAISQVNQGKLRPEERNKTTTANGNIFLKMDNELISYIVIAVNTYSERHAFAMIKEMEKAIKQIPDFISLQGSKINMQIKSQMEDLMEKYNSVSSVDKVGQAQQAVENVQIVMEQNVKKMLENTQLQQLEGKSEELKQKSSAFYKSSNELAKIMYWRNCKLKIIIGLIVLAVLLYILVPIIMASQH